MMRRIEDILNCKSISCKNKETSDELKDNDELLNEMNYGDEYHPHFFLSFEFEYYISN